jgi:UDP-glucuronate 4-epimerase
MHALVTGAAGFIGFHLSLRLLNEGHSVVGLDNLNDYYDPELKKARLKILRQRPAFKFHLQDLAKAEDLTDLFHTERFSHVAHLAAQAGVRYSLKNPAAYIQSNLVGFANLLEACRANPVEHLVYASSSSVYGLNGRLPFSEHAGADHPVSLYAATKKGGEALAHSYSHLFALPCTGLRFFTVYGPWGRPDMALFSFTRNILNGQPIEVYNDGRMLRDFTYIEDIIDGVYACLQKPAAPAADWNPERPDPATSSAPYRLYNVGNNNPVELERFINVLEQALGRAAVRNYLPPQPGDVPATCADIEDLRAATGFTPKTGIEEGIPQFVAWFLNYYGR